MKKIIAFAVIGFSLTLLFGSNADAQVRPLSRLPRTPGAIPLSGPSHLHIYQQGRHMADNLPGGAKIYYDIGQSGQVTGARLRAHTSIPLTESARFSAGRVLGGAALSFYMMIPVTGDGCQRCGSQPQPEQILRPGQLVPLQQTAVYNHAPQMPNFPPGRR